MNPRKLLAALLLAALLLTAVSCSSGNTSGEAGDSGSNQTPQDSQDQQGSQAPDPLPLVDPDDSPDPEEGSFAQAHESFQTKLAREENDSDPIPDPPEGAFDLIRYPSQVGDLAAYVSSDPGDGEKHPMIIWVVGGWGNGIDDFPWTYPAWDNDQTGSAFWREGVLTMYPSFRGGNGNPGYYEALYGEVDDILSAYEYAASLPYVDPERIYLGGHSTGGTRALLASEHSDVFRAVFCFGAVDDIRYHNNSQFTFDTEDEMEYTMRSPIHWLDDVKSPTFLIEGSDGNSDSLKNIQSSSTNDSIHCYLLEGSDHFAPLGPITPLLARKILADTGAECNITVTQEELEQAMAGEAPVITPLMVRRSLDTIGMSLEAPYIWELADYSADGETEFGLMSRYEEDNPWDMAAVYIYVYPAEENELAGLKDSLAAEGFEVQDRVIGGASGFEGYGVVELSEGNYFTNRFIMAEYGSNLIELEFYLHEDFGDAGDALFEQMVSSISFE